MSSKAALRMIIVQATACSDLELQRRQAVAAYAAKKVAQEWTPEKAAEYMLKNVEIVEGYNMFAATQDGYAALAMLRAYAESLHDAS
jgi:hypothetical protein